MVVARRTRTVCPDVRTSWQRARHHGLHPDRHPPEVGLGTDELRVRQRDRRLAAIWPVLFANLEAAATESGHVLFGADGEGHLLWVHGDSSARRTAERANLVPGALWNEITAGTNGVGTALTLGRPFQVRGPEHYLSVAADFTCTAAPVRDPLNGDVIGVVDVTCRMDRVNRLALPLVTAAARLAEAHLRDIGRSRDAEIRTRYLNRVMDRSGEQGALVAPDGRVLFATPRGWLPAVWPGPIREGETLLPNGRRVAVHRLVPQGPFAIHVIPRSSDSGETPRAIALGRARVSLWMDGAVHQLSLRHSELLVILLAHPGGLTAKELAEAMYGHHGKAVTVRAELARFRRIVGYHLSSDPYRLDSRIRCDVLELGTGPLLPRSSAPGIQRIREELRNR